jgi:hypothetical protein
MKYISLLLLITLASCSKSGSNNPGTTSAGNNITVVDNGKTYTMTGQNQITTTNSLIEVTIIRNSVNSKLEVSTAGKTGTDFNIAFKATGDTTALGSYKLDNGWYSQAFSGGQYYTADSGRVTISTASKASIMGSFVLYLKGNKKVTGNINAKEVEFLP